MKPINSANWLIVDLLISIYKIFDIGLDEYYEDIWLYSSCYPLQINDEKFTYHGMFSVHIFKWNEKLQCLKLIPMKFRIQSETSIVYISDSNLDAEINELGESIVDSEKFTSEIKPLLIQGLREYKIHYLLQ